MGGIDARFRLGWPGFSLDVDINLPGRGVTALFGHSGSGKTTLLRCIAGLERAPQGRLAVDGVVWQDTGRWVPPHQRAIGYVFQEASLFAHLTVMGNLRYGIKRSGEAQRVSLDHTIELLGIGHLLDRKPERLSGGERQRVGIARALAVSPRLLLMDEPLSALDLKRKREILPYLERLHDELDIPVLYVSHSPDEVARLADHLVLMDAGRVVADGPLIEQLARLDVRGLGEDERGTVIEASVAGHDDEFGLMALAFDGGMLRVAQRPLPVGRPVRVYIPAGDVSLALGRHEHTSILNVLEARVEEVAPLGEAQLLVRLRLGRGDATTALLARITRKSGQLLGLQPGLMVYAQIKSVSLMRAL